MRGNNQFYPTEKYSSFVQAGDEKPGVVAGLLMEHMSLCVPAEHRKRVIFPIRLNRPGEGNGFVISWYYPGNTV